METTDVMKFFELLLILLIFLTILEPPLVDGISMMKSRSMFVQIELLILCC